MQYRWLKCKKLLDREEISYAGSFVVADWESKLNIQKFKMADPIWVTKLSPEIFLFEAFITFEKFFKYFAI